MRMPAIPSRRPTVVLLGMMSKHPVAGVVWQTIHYLVGFERLGYTAYYVEAGAHQPSSMLVPDDWTGDRSEAAAGFIDSIMRRFDLGDRWAFHALHSDERCYGLSAAELQRLYCSAALLVNLHGATEPLPEHSATGRLIYLETDPVLLQVELTSEPLPSSSHTRPSSRSPKTTATWIAAYQLPSASPSSPRASRWCWTSGSTT